MIALFDIIREAMDRFRTGCQGRRHCAENRESMDNMRGEIKQAIAMLYRLWIESDQVHGLPPVSPRFEIK